MNQKLNKFPEDCVDSCNTILHHLNDIFGVPLTKINNKVLSNTYMFCVSWIPAVLFHTIYTTHYRLASMLEYTCSSTQQMILFILVYPTPPIIVGRLHYGTVTRWYYRSKRSYVNKHSKTFMWSDPSTKYVASTTLQNLRGSLFFSRELFLSHQTPLFADVTKTDCTQKTWTPYACESYVSDFFAVSNCLRVVSTSSFLGHQVYHHKSWTTSLHCCMSHLVPICRIFRRTWVCSFTFFPIDSGNTILCLPSCPNRFLLHLLLVDIVDIMQISIHSSLTDTE